MKKTYIILSLIIACLCLSGCNNNSNKQTNEAAKQMTSTMNVKKIESGEKFDAHNKAITFNTRNFEDSYECQFKVKVDTIEETFYNYGFLQSAYYFYDENDDYLILELYGDNDARSLLSLDLNANKLVMKEIGNYSLMDIENGAYSEFTLLTQHDILSSYNCTSKYIFKDGAFNLVEDKYIVTDDYQPTLVIKSQLPVYDDNELIYLQPGQEITIIETNNKDQVIVKTTDNKQYTIKYDFDEDEYIFYIDDVEEYDYFEELYYAG